MSSVAVSPNKSETNLQSRFGSAESLLRVLARKIPEADHSDEALALQMNTIANRFHQENLYDFDRESTEDLEYLIGLMQFADYIIDIAENKPAAKKVLSMVEEIQSSNEKYSDIVDVMISISKNESKSSVQSLLYILTHRL